MRKTLSKGPRFQLKKHLLSKKKFYYFGKLADESGDKKRLSDAELGSDQSSETILKFTNFNLVKAK